MSGRSSSTGTGRMRWLWDSGRWRQGRWCAVPFRRRRRTGNGTRQQMNHQEAIMYQIRTLNKIHRRGMALLDARYTVNGSGLEDGVLVRSASMHEYEAPDSLLAVARAGAGVNNIPVDAFTR